MTQMTQMRLNRRSFFSLFAAGAAALAVDPERLLWVPGAKLISVPAPALSNALDVEADALAALISMLDKWRIERLELIVPSDAMGFRIVRHATGRDVQQWLLSEAVARKYGRFR